MGSRGFSRANDTKDNDVGGGNASDAEPFVVS